MLMSGKERRKKRTPAEILADLKAEVATLELSVQLDQATETGPLKDLAYDRRTILEDGKTANTALSVDESKSTSFEYRISGHLAWVSIWKGEQDLCQMRVNCSEVYLPLVTSHLEASVAYSVDHAEEELREFIEAGMAEILGEEYETAMEEIRLQGQIVAAMRAARKASDFNAVEDIFDQRGESGFLEFYSPEDEELLSPEDDPSYDESDTTQTDPPLVEESEDDEDEDDMEDED
jgi:hypothetical protein